MNSKLLGSVVCLFVAGTANAVENYTYKNNSAYGEAGVNSYDCDWDPNGNGDGSYRCHYESNYAYANGYSSITHVAAGAAPVAAPGGWVSFSTYVQDESYDATAGTWSYSYDVSGGGGLITGFAFNKLNTATLTGTADLCTTSYDSETGEYLNECSGNAAVRATFTGVGDTYRGMQINTSHGPWGMQRSKSSGSSREATFTLTAGGANVVPADGYTYAYLSQTNGGSLYRYDNGGNGHGHP